MTIKTFRKKPVEIEAIEYLGNGDQKIADWCGGTLVSMGQGFWKIEIPTLEGTVTASPGDWEQMAVKLFDIDAAVESVSEAARAAFVEMQRWGLLGPASAGESWPTWQAVPDGIWFTGNGLGPIVAHRKRGSLVDNRDRNGETIVLPDFLDATYPSGPFVPVEVDLTPASAAARCPICFGLNGLHNRIHERYPAGGGGTNKPCPNTPPDDEPESL